jgi:hypothetical protein
MKPGFIYVLIHPSDPDLYKIGITILDPKKRLAQHNNDLTKLAGSYVKETGQKWELKEFHPVPDPYNAEKAFWNSMPFVDVPFMGNGEVMRLGWQDVHKGLEAAKRVGVRARLSEPPAPDLEIAYVNSAKEQLQKRNITIVGNLKTTSKYGTFVCGNGHRWRMSPDLVIKKGTGCYYCGAGAEDSI